MIARLNALLLPALPPGGPVEVVSPGRIQAGPRTSLEPDILVYSAPLQRNATWTDIASWWLAVEVLSPSTRVYDTEWKRQAYQGLGVEQVWLVDPDAERMSVWTGVNPVPEVFTDQVTWQPIQYADAHLRVDLGTLFA